MRSTHAKSTGLFLLIAVALAAATAAPAGAAQFHPYEFSFNGSGASAGQFEDIDQVAVEQQTGNVFVLDRLKSVIDKFDAAGNPLNFSSTGTSSLDVPATCPGFQFNGENEDIAVDSSGGPHQGMIYAASYLGETKFCAFHPDGSLAYGIKGSEEPMLNNACGVTVDTQGKLWIGTDNAMQFTATGSPPTVVTIIQVGGLCRIAIGSAGNVFVTRWYSQGIDRWTVAGLQQELTQSGNSVGIDPATEHVYVALSDRVIEFTQDGQKISETGVGVPFDQTGQGRVGNGWGVAVRGSSGRMYVADRSTNTIKVYGPLGTFPDVSTGGTSEVRRTSAALAGQVVPAGGDVTSCKFEWGKDSSYGQMASCTEATPISAQGPVSAALTGLEPGTIYHYRLIASNSNGPNYGADGTFETPFVNGVQTGDPAAISRTAATLNGSLDPAGVSTHYYFEWGTDESYGQTSPAPPGTDAGSGDGIVAASTGISGLVLDTTYHYRLVAQNAGGTTLGSDRTLHTKSAVLGVSTSNPSAITQTAATLNGTLDPDGRDTHYYFEWGPNSSYGNTTSAPPGVQVGPASGATSVSAALSGLSSYTTYHYRLVATNDLGTTKSPDATFTTEPPVLPGISGTSVAEITTSSAMLGAQITPGSGATVFRFQYGESPAYGNKTATSAPIEGVDGVHPVNVAINELNPATLYHFRAIAINFSGATYGPDQTFTTATLPGPPAVPSVTPPGIAPLVPPTTKPPVVVRCRKNFVKKQGRCVKKKRPKGKRK